MSARGGGLADGVGEGAVEEVDQERPGQLGGENGLPSGPGPPSTAPAQQALYFGNSSEYWMNLQANYDLKVARRNLKPEDAERIKAQRVA